MHQSSTRSKPNQAPAANNRSARKKAERRSRSSGAEIIQARGISASAGSKGANKRRKAG